MPDPEPLERITARRAELDETEAAPETSAHRRTWSGEPGLPEPTGIGAGARHPHSMCPYGDPTYGALLSNAPRAPATVVP